METSLEEKAEESFLKIDTIWSEADEKYENIAVKEEIVSDLEPESILPNAETGNSDVEHSNGFDIPKPDNLIEKPISSWQPFRRKVKSKKNEEAENADNPKSTCSHDTKNFKIVKKRLRCGDCRSLVCPECCKVMMSTLQSHFVGSDVKSCDLYSCKLCCMAFHSVCALQAHIRIHSMDTPYVCPDCGLIYNNIYFLILHLINKCYHVHKVVRYKCRNCPGAYFNQDTFVQHIQEQHIDCVFRCSYCSSLFSNPDEFNSHMDHVHQKLKVQFLNYFRCSLCSNMVIPRFMFQKHIDHHRDSPESYEVDYRCLCGELYTSMGAFRAHIQLCDKRGILPPHWSFLQRKLRTQDVTYGEKIRIKDGHTLRDHSNISIEPRMGKFNLLRTSNELGKMRKSDTYDAKSEDKSPENRSADLCLKVAEKLNSLAAEVNDFAKKHDASEDLTSSRTQTEDDSNPVHHVELINSNVTPNIQLREELVAEVEESVAVDRETTKPEDQDNRNETETIDADVSKIFYDHIPCDHLGYVKTQPDSGKKESGEDKNATKDYRIVTELDDKTGFITSRKVPAENSEEEVENYDENFGEETDNINNTQDFSPKVLGGDKLKLKLANSYFTCPFCIVVFPKHNSSFQQFKLHVECYHPDAALNITVYRDDEKTETSAAEPEGVETTSRQNDFVSETPKQVCNRSNQKKNKRKIEVMSEGCLHKDHEGSNEQKEEKKRTSTDDDGETLTKVSKSRQNKEVYWTVNVSLPNGGPGDDEASRDNENLKDVKETHLKEKYELPTSKAVKQEDLSKSQDEKQNGVTLGDAKEIPPEYAQDEEMVFDEHIVIKTEQDDSEAKECMLIPDGEGIWERIVDIKISPTEDITEFIDDTTVKPKSEKSRRESEVWSEFYESLKLAERLKKNKKKKTAAIESRKKSIVVPDYSTKRVVKKPKRYRESSDSDDSGGGMDNSDSETSLVNDITLKTEEDCGEDVGQEKKQKLLNKLQNVDQKFVDYLFDLIDKKEKCFELYQKHSSLRASRYSQDLRSYRKKVLNGIKHRGRPHKLLRYQELVKKKEAAIDERFKEDEQKGLDDKTNEKKRGRPRKIGESARLKERRRSDKEVNFIEKNFEREETETSPSKRKRKLSSKLQYYKKINLPDEKDEFSSGQVIVSKSADSNKKFSCAVCKEVYQDVTELREHVVVHRMEENTYQCMECGECFVVRPSLEKHLHAFHKIKNTDKYITDNECCSVKKEAQEPEAEPLKENQCKVCKDQFDRPIDLTKHFRIHGMAFLKEFKKDGKAK